MPSIYPTDSNCRRWLLQVYSSAMNEIAAASTTSNKHPKQADFAPALPHVALRVSFLVTFVQLHRVGCRIIDLVPQPYSFCLGKAASLSALHRTSFAHAPNNPQGLHFSPCGSQHNHLHANTH